jgi:transcription initiation factor TFIIB
MRVEHATDRCTECGGAARVVEGEAVCEQCGLVVADQGIDHGPEWRSLDDEVDRRRTGSVRTRTRHDRGLSTRIGFGDGATAARYWSRRLVRMRRQHRRAQVSSTRERNKIYAFTEIQRLMVALGLPEPLDEQSCALFESAQQEDLLYGRTIEGFAAAAVYAGCRTRSLPRTMAEVTTVAKADRDELKAAYGALNRELGLRTGPIHPREFLPRYASTLGLSSDVETRAREYAAALTEDGMLCGKKPNGVAAACLYAAARDLGEGLTQAEAADAAGVSQMTIRSTVQELR